MLLDRKTLDGIAAGDIRLQFRRWRRPTVRTGGTLRTRIGLLQIDEVSRIDESQITEEEARAAGADNRTALIERLNRRNQGELYRIAFRRGGHDPRIALRESDDLTPIDIAEIDKRLDRMDANTAWTRATLELIRNRPGTRAADLAEELHMERLPFKANVRKLKELGLTISLERGYRLSPRGAAYLRLREKRARRR